MPHYEVSVVIASMNEEDSIEECISKTQSVFHEHGITGEIIIADNSTDSTPVIATRLGASVITPDTLGYGHALIQGIDHTNGSYIVMADADSTYDLEEMPKLLDPLRRGEADLVIGSRFSGRIERGAMPRLHQYVGNPVLTWILNRRLGTRVTDAHSGFRAFSKSAWDKMDKTLIPDDFCSEMLKQMARDGARIAEVPIVYHLRKGHIKAGTVLHGWRVFSFLFKHVVFG